MEILKSQEFKDELFLSNTAWLFIILAASTAYFSGTNIFTSQIAIQATNELMDSMTPEAREHMKDMQSIQLGIIVYIYGSFIISLLVLLSAIVMLKRKRWGKILFNVVMVSTVLLILGAVFYLRQQFIANFPMVGNSFGDQAMNKMKLASQWQMKSYLIFLALIAWAFVRMLIKLNRKRMANYFE